jgi:uncharacterized membrane protein YkgB
MNTSAAAQKDAITRRVAQIELIVTIFLRYGLVVAIGWIGAMKSTHYEAVGIQPLIARCPAYASQDFLDLACKARLPLPEG